mmetsp:Transcript_19456/g.65734  ORF Transcript_19456/g.65734 Transcript_19456/m.65734 type:complete len:353 (+) Transcript_19456:1029-2087(+)
MCGPGLKDMVTRSRISVVARITSSLSLPPTISTCCASTKTAAQPQRSVDIEGPGAKDMDATSRNSVVVNRPESALLPPAMRMRLPSSAMAAQPERAVVIVGPRAKVKVATSRTIVVANCAAPSLPPTTSTRSASICTAAQPERPENVGPGDSVSVDKVRISVAVGYSPAPLMPPTTRTRSASKVTAANSVIPFAKSGPFENCRVSTSKTSVVNNSDPSSEPPKTMTRLPAFTEAKNERPSRISGPARNVAETVQGREPKTAFWRPKYSISWSMAAPVSCGKAANEARMARSLGGSPLRKSKSMPNRAPSRSMKMEPSVGSLGASLRANILPSMLSSTRVSTPRDVSKCTPPT